jgi:peptidyl-prolyl cis-trans isomerase D
MFELIRNHRRWMQFILMLLIVPSFFLVGIQGYDSFMRREPELVNVADLPVTRAEFDRAHSNVLEQFRRRVGDQFDPFLIDTPAMRQQLLNELIDDHVLNVAAFDYRLSVSDKRLRSAIVALDWGDGQGNFSPSAYLGVLASQGMTPTAFEASQRHRMALQQVLGPIAVSARAPTVVAAAYEAAQLQKRSLRTRTYKAADFKSSISITPQDIQAWYDANKAQLEVPEHVNVDYLVLDEAATTQGVTVSDTDIANYFEQNQARFVVPEGRSFSHILFEAPAGAGADVRQAARAKAEDLAKQAALHPETFATLARENSQDAGSAVNGGDLGQWRFADLGNTLGTAIQQAVFKLAKDQVSDVVESPAGFHIIKVTQIQPMVSTPLAEVKEQVSAEIRQQMAAARFADMATQLTKLVYDERDSLQPAADALGLKVRRFNGLTRSGVIDAEAAGAADSNLLDSVRVRQVVFSPELLKEKQNSGVIQISPAILMVVLAAQVQAAAVPPVEQVSSQIRATLLSERSAQAAKQAGEKTLQANPSAALDGFSPVIEVSRAQPNAAVPLPVMQAVMVLPASSLPAHVGVPMGLDFVVARLESVAPGASNAAIQAAVEQRLSAALGEAESMAVLRMLRDQYKVKALPAVDRVVQGEARADAS